MIFFQASLKISIDKETKQPQVMGRINGKEEFTRYFRSLKLRNFPAPHSGSTCSFITLMLDTPTVFSESLQEPERDAFNLKNKNSF